jgi:GTP-binding nuclear protein Ran
LVGNGEVGKTTFLKMFLTNAFEEKYVATLGVEVYPIMFSTNYGSVILNMWDTAGQDAFGELTDGRYIMADGALVFHTSDIKRTYKWWEMDFTRNTGSPMVRVQTKMDVGSGMCPDGSVPISTKNRINVLGPIVAILNKMLKVEDAIVYT